MPAEWNNGETENIFFSNPFERSHRLPVGHPATFLFGLKRLLQRLTFPSVSLDFGLNVCSPYPLLRRPFCQEKISACIAVKWFCLFFHRVRVYRRSAWCVMQNEITLTAPNVICTPACFWHRSAALLFFLMRGGKVW